MILIQTTHFKVKRVRKRLEIRAKSKDVTPIKRTIKPSDLDYLLGLDRKPNPFTGVSTFDMSCVLDFGVGVFAR